MCARVSAYSLLIILTQRSCVTLTRDANLCLLRFQSKKKLENTMADGTTTMLPSRKWSMPRLGSKVHVSIGDCGVRLEREMYPDRFVFFLSGRLKRESKRGWITESYSVVCRVSVLFSFRCALRCMAERSEAGGYRCPPSLSLLSRNNRISSVLPADKPELIEPTNKELFNRLASCNTLFKEGNVSVHRLSLHMRFSNFSSNSTRRRPRCRYARGPLCLSNSAWYSLSVTLKTISSYARMQTIAIGSKATTVDAFKLMRKCVG